MSLLVTCNTLLQEYYLLDQTFFFFFNQNCCLWKDKQNFYLGPFNWQMWLVFQCSRCIQSLSVLKLRIFNRNLVMSKSSTFCPEGKAHVLKWLEISPNKTFNTFFFKEQRSWNLTAYNSSGNLIAFLFKMCTVLCLCIEPYAWIYNSMPESYKFQRRNWWTLTLAFLYFIIFSASQFSQISVVPPKTGPSQGHVCLVTLLWDCYSNISRIWTGMIHEDLHFTDVEYLKPSILKNPTSSS